MPEEPIITMTEFKTVVEEFKSEQKKMAEYMLFLNQKIDSGFIKIDKAMNTGFHSLREQIGLLHEGQTEIKLSLKLKVDRDEFASLEKRVARLENKVA